MIGAEKCPLLAGIFQPLAGSVDRLIENIQRLDASFFVQAIPFAASSMNLRSFPGNQIASVDSLIS